VTVSGQCCGNIVTRRRAQGRSVTNGSVWLSVFVGAFIQRAAEGLQGHAQSRADPTLTAIPPNFEQPYLSATCSVWGILGLNRGVHPLVHLMRSFPRAYTPTWRFTSGTLTPLCAASVAWRHVRCYRSVAARTRTPGRWS